MPETESARRSVEQIEISLSFVHRTNIERYKTLLGTDLGDSERTVVQQQLVKEQAALRRLALRNAR